VLYRCSTAELETLLMVLAERTTTLKYIDIPGFLLAHVQQLILNNSSNHIRVVCKKYANADLRLNKALILNLST